MQETFDLIGDTEAIVCGDFNFDNSSKAEARVYQDAGYEDVLCKYFPDSAPWSFTRYKTPTKCAARFDKILLKSKEILPIAGQICGKFSTPLFEQRNEHPELISQDGLVRTPSDHCCVIADFTFT